MIVKEISILYRQVQEIICTLTQLQDREEKERDEEERKRMREWIDAFSAKTGDEEKKKKRRAWYIEKEKPTIGEYLC